MTFVGIDPGVRGAIAALDAWGSVLWIEDMPTFTGVGGGKRRDYDTKKLVELIPRDSCVFVERQSPRPYPPTPPQANFKIGYGFGLLVGILDALSVRYTVVLPQVWQRDMFPDGVGEGGKARSIITARRLFPNVSITRHDQADALLIAEWGRMRGGV